MLEVWHEGRCGRCNRALTVPESIASGIGPECAKHVLGPAPTFPFEAEALSPLEVEAAVDALNAVNNPLLALAKHFEAR